MALSTRQKLESAELVFAIVHVTAGTKACADHGDLPTATQLNAFYTLAADTVRPADGRVVKQLGDGMLLAFPPARARDAATALRALQREGNLAWQRFDPRCRVQVSVGVGRVAAGPFGPAGDERFDIYGDALNRLFKLPFDEFVSSPEFARLVS